MTFADKVLSLRKSRGWSQEELAEKLDVSRQSVSKWESGAAAPEVGKIPELACLFGVSTDFLLLSSAQPAASAPQTADVVHVSLEDATAFLAFRRHEGRMTGLGVLLCILSPAALILLTTLSERGAATAVGLTLLLLFVAAGVTIFIVTGERAKRFAALEKGTVELGLGVESAVRERALAVRPRCAVGTAAGVALCILSAMPLLIAGALGASDFVCILLTVLLLVVVSLATFILVYSSAVGESFDLLLCEGEFHPRERAENKATEKFSGVYWPVVTAGYLLWSFLSNDWRLTWVVWPVAALVFAGICALLHRDG